MLVLYRLAQDFLPQVAIDTCSVLYVSAMSIKFRLTTSSSSVGAQVSVPLQVLLVVTLMPLHDEERANVLSAKITAVCALCPSTVDAVCMNSKMCF